MWCREDCLGARGPTFSGHHGLSFSDNTGPVRPAASRLAVEFIDKNHASPGPIMMNNRPQQNWRDAVAMDVCSRRGYFGMSLSVVDFCGKW